MGVIRVYENPLDSREFREFSHSGPLIDFLLDKFPNGFDGRGHVALRNLKQLRIEEYDQEVGEAEVILALHPGWAAFVGIVGEKVAEAVVAAIVMTIISYAVNAIFGPKGVKPTLPAYSNKSAASPDAVYAFSGASNTARVGQVIPVGYGRNLMVPDVASQPYTYFENNEQYLVQLLCLGQGNYTINKLKIAGMKQSQLEAGVLSVWHFPHSSHSRQFGYIESQTSLFENVFTSPAVADQVLTAKKIEIVNGNYQGPPSGGSSLPDGQPDSAAMSVRLNNGYVDVGLYGEQIELRGVFTLKAANSGNINFREYRDSLVNAGKKSYVKILKRSQNLETGEYSYEELFDGDSFEVQKYLEPNSESLPYDSGFITETWPSEVNLNDSNLFLTVAYQSANNRPSGVPDDKVIYGDVVGPILAVPDHYSTSLLMYDLVFPSGCWWMQEDGNLGWMYVEVYFYAQQIDDNDSPFGDIYIYWYAESLGTNTPQRRTLYHHVPTGRYRVSAQRVSGVSKKAGDQSEVVWTSLKAKLDPPANSNDVYGDVHLTMVKIKATNGLASSAHQQISVDATRHEGTEFAPNDNDSYRITLTDGNLDNAVACMIDIYMNSDYGGMRPSSELALDYLEPLQGEFSAKKFNAVFDDETTVWDAMKLALQMHHAGPTMVGSKIGVAVDQAVTGYDALFEERSIVSLSVTYMFATADDNDGVEGEYRNADDGAAEYAIYPLDSVNPEQVKLWGCRSKNQAENFVERSWNQSVKRRRLITMEIETEAHVLQIGQVIGIKHTLLKGVNAVERCVISAVKVNSEFSTSIEGYIYEPSVY